MIPPETAAEESVHWECYRHPGAEAGVKCRRCERPICARCMITAPVGFQCPECVKGAPAVRSLRSLRVEPYLTYTLVAVNVVVALFALSGGSVGRGNGLADDFALYGPAVAAGEWWRLFTSGFLHYGLLHLGFNMLVLFQLGSLLEPAVGRLRFAASLCDLTARWRLRGTAAFPELVDGRSIGGHLRAPRGHGRHHARARGERDAVRPGRAPSHQSPLHLCDPGHLDRRPSGWAGRRRGGRTGPGGEPWQGPEEPGHGAGRLPRHRRRG